MPPLSALLTVLVYVTVILVMLWAITKLMATWELDGKIQSTIYIFLVVVIAIWLLYNVLPMVLPHMGSLRPQG